MGFDPSQYLVVGISSRALFDLTESNSVFESQGLEAYTRYQREHEDEVLEPGAAFPLVKAILALNNIVPGERKSEVIIMSRNSADTSLRIFRSIEHYGLDVTRAVLSGGADLARYLEAFDVDLFLSALERDVQGAINAGFAAGLIYGLPEDESYGDLPPDQIRIAFDGDAVLFSDESERIYQEQGMEAFQEHERQNARKPMSEGPFAKLLRTLSSLQSEVSTPESPIRTALVTARNFPAHERAIRTLREWDVRIDEAFFLGGMDKDPVLRAFRPHIFFDDQDRYCGPASKHMAVARVPYRTRLTSPMVTTGGDLTAPEA